MIAAALYAWSILAALGLGVIIGGLLGWFDWMYWEELEGEDTT